jgi:hypothetical protein
MPTFIEESMLSAALKSCRRNHLRLVTASAHQATESQFESNSTPCLRLESVCVEKDNVTFGVITNLFKQLRAGERIVFVHRLEKTGNKPYELTVNVACQPTQKARLCETVAEAITTAYPSFNFVRCDDATANSEIAASTPTLTHGVQFAPAGVVVAPMPAFSRFESSEDRQRAALGHAAQGKKQVWPFPGKWINWPLTAPLDEPLELPDVVEISVRIHSFTLAPDTTESLYQALMRLEAGNLATFHPDSAITAYSASGELGASAIDLMRHWLRHPNEGYAVDLVIRSSGAMSEIARRRIAADVFGNKLPFAEVSSFSAGQEVRLATPTLSWACALTQGLPALLPGLAILPSLGVARHYGAPVMTPPTVGAMIGKTVCGRGSSQVALPADSRSRHVAIFGATGSGKSSLMTQMIAEDVLDPERKCGVGLIDPHGDLYNRILGIIPPDRIDDVILIDTADLEHTACLNPLEGMRDDPLTAQFIVGEIMSLIELLFETKDSSGPMLRSNLRHLLLLSISMPGRNCTFLDAMRILEDRDFRDYLLSKCKNRGVVDYWQNFKKTSGEHGYESWLPYIQARLSSFVTNPIMKRLLCRPNSTINLAQAMREKKIILFNLNKGVLQDVECQILGSLILTKFFSAALSGGQTAAERPAFHLYVDEFQTFATDSVPKLFSEGRKYNLCLTTANQSIGQLQNRWGRTNIAEAILANTATKFLFRLGPADIDLLQPYFKPQFDSRDMAAMPDFHAVACMSDRNRPLPPFVMRSNFPEVSQTAQSSADSVREAARRYTVPVAQANKELSRIYDLSMESLGATDDETEVNEPERSEVKPQVQDLSAMDPPILIRMARGIIQETGTKLKSPADQDDLGVNTAQTQEAANGS